MGNSRNPQTLGIERPPRNPLPANYNPGGVPHQVSDGEDWQSVAKQFGVDVRRLIFFNFHTQNPDEVNWYLRRNVGCNLPTIDGLNWKFSTSAKPGVIYVPETVMTLPEDLVPDPGGRNALARWLDNLPEVPEPGEGWEYFHFVLDLAEFVHIVTAVFEIGETALAVGALEVLAPIGGTVAVWLEIGGAHKDALAHKKRDYTLRGVADGLALGTNGAKKSYIDYNFRNRRVAYDDVYPEQNGNFQKAYQDGVTAGVTYGRMLNSNERRRLGKILLRKMGWSVDKNTKSWNEMSDAEKLKYYKAMAAVIRSDFLPR
jgi:hypothetical protein